MQFVRLLFLLSSFMINASTVTYREVFHPVVQAVLEGDVEKFKRGLEAFGADVEKYAVLHKILPHFRSLRHVAYHSEIDNILQSWGVALVAIKIYVDRKGKGKILYYPKSAEVYDIWGKCPEEYSYAERQQLAKSMMESYYHLPKS